MISLASSIPFRVLRLLGFRRFVVCVCGIHSYHVVMSIALHLCCRLHPVPRVPSRCPFRVPELPHVSVASSRPTLVFGRVTLPVWREACRVLCFGVCNPPVKSRRVWSSFGAPTVILVGSKCLHFEAQDTPPKAHQTSPNLSLHLGHPILIAWPKTTPHLDNPGSLCLYICPPSSIFAPKIGNPSPHLLPPASSL